MAKNRVEAGGIITLDDERIAFEPLQQEIDDSKCCYNDDPLFDDAALGPFAHVVNIGDKLSAEKKKKPPALILMAFCMELLLVLFYADRDFNFVPNKVDAIGIDSVQQPFVFVCFLRDRSYT